LRKLVVEEYGLYVMAEHERDILKYYANSIAHLPVT